MKYSSEFVTNNVPTDNKTSRTIMKAQTCLVTVHMQVIEPGIQTYRYRPTCTCTRTLYTGSLLLHERINTSCCTLHA